MHSDVKVTTTSAGILPLPHHWHELKLQPLLGIPFFFFLPFVIAHCFIKLQLLSYS